MAHTEVKALFCSFLLLPSLHTASGMSGWGGCLDGQNVFATVRENSLWGEFIAELRAETTLEGVKWILHGKDADWFFLDEGNIRLNTSADKVLDREAQGPVLIAELLCYEEDTLQSVYKIMVEIHDENDNSPVFAEDVLSLIISELTAVNTVVFTVHATDADNNEIIYSIDQNSPDAEYFRVDLPNSGKVILSKPLDYETKTQLAVTVHASEMSTIERFNTSINITIIVLDGDDQYPQFLPCMLLFQDETSRICSSPVYTVNVTEGQEDVLLEFSPGPIHAVDGDRGLSSPVSYAIISGDEGGRFLMDRKTGEVKLIHGIQDRLIIPSIHLQVMAYQDDDPRKYAVAAVLVRVLAVNHFNPEFSMAEYKGFVIAGKSLATLVNTYGSEALMLHAQDQDFNNGFNPMIRFTLSPASNHTDIYQITPEGLLITRTGQLKPKQKHVLEVMAVDQESGDTTFANVVVEVLFEGQSIPHSSLGDRITGCTVGKALFLSLVFMTAIGCVLWLSMWLKKIHKARRDPLERGCVAQGKHPNVSLRWFQMLSHRTTMPQAEEVPHNTEEYGTYNLAYTFTDNPSNYKSRGSSPPRVTTPPDTSFIRSEAVHSPVILNNVSTPSKSSSSFPACHPATVDMSPTCTAQPKESSTQTPPDQTEGPSSTSPCTTTRNTSDNPPIIHPDSQSTQKPTSKDPAEAVNSPSFQSSIPCSQARIPSADIDKPFCKTHVKTLPLSPLMTPPIPKKMSTPPATPDHASLKATLVHVDMSPLDSPLAAPELTSMPLSPEEDQPCTLLDQTDQTEQSGEVADAGSSSQDRKHFTNSVTKQDCKDAVDADDDGFLGDEDADKNSDGEDGLDPEEDELLRVLARCNPIFLSFSK